MLYFIDIETIPNQTIDPALEPVFDPSEVKVGNIKDPEKINAKIADEKWKFEKELDKEMSLDGALFQVVAFGYAIVNPRTLEVEREDVVYGAKSDAAILAFVENLFGGESDGEDKIVTWNGKRFDLPQLQRRGWVKGKRIFPRFYYPEIVNPYQDKKSLDLKYVWHPEGKDSLEKCALALGIPSPKTTLDGSKVFTAWKEGKEREICDYCQGDVRTMIEVYRRIVHV